VDRDRPAVGFLLDQLQLVGGAVDHHPPASLVLLVTGFCLVERGGNHLVRVVFDGSGEPLRAGFWPLSRDAARGAAAGRGDDVMRPARRRVSVMHHRQGCHPLATRLLPGGQTGAEGAGSTLGGLARRLPQMAGEHRDPLAVDAEHQQRRVGCGRRGAGGIEGGDVHRAARTSCSAWRLPSGRVPQWRPTASTAWS
jgi:hypothetical protein